MKMILVAALMLEAAALRVYFTWDLPEGLHDFMKGGFIVQLVPTLLMAFCWCTDAIASAYEGLQSPEAPDADKLLEVVVDDHQPP